MKMHVCVVYADCMIEKQTVYQSPLLKAVDAPFAFF
ncbi:hypothetical protein EVA_11336 [gut metagenome]|uniref:Uncharacterized protein n=1 Tax=gut metagenome TaxID=749906 RepID=J9G183_9ZZZZ